ncbi:Cobalamin biosynthesis protein CobT VWA domain protein [Flavonifractor plautii]|uniref:Cobalamin biosynthesis protein CobT VWA domain protein n=2 Tax=Flavonifractor plautii TaxID=292800 RepID=A0A6N3DK22_FLAPL
MRASHLTVRKRIMDEKSKITDEEFFTSKEYRGYLADITEAATKRYRRPIHVTVFADPEDSTVAYTDYNGIVINACNHITWSMPTRKLRSMSIEGFNAHENSHNLFTDNRIAHAYFNSLEHGKFYPKKPTRLKGDQKLNAQGIIDALMDDTDPIPKTVILRTAKALSNILEDGYVDARYSYEFPGNPARGIALNNVRFAETVPDIDTMIDKQFYPHNIVLNLLLEYVRAREVNNLTGYTGEYMDRFLAALPLVDACIYDEDSRARFDAVNRIMIDLWPLMQRCFDDLRDKQQNDASSSSGSGNSTTPGTGEDSDSDDGMDAVQDALESQLPQIAPNFTMKSGPVPFNGAFSPDEEQAQELLEQVSKALSEETARIAAHRTETIISNGDGSIVQDSEYEGAGYEFSATDIERVLEEIATGKVNESLEEELSEELQSEATSIEYGNAHRNINITVHRMSHVNQNLIDSYTAVAPQLLMLSKRLQRSVSAILRDKRQGGKQTGLYVGKHLDQHAFHRNDGRVFCNKRLPTEPINMSVALLVDESGSMCGCDRITKARATAIVVQDFCEKLGIPIMIVGHTASCAHVELFSYADFKSVDKKDRYRLMDMSARCCNRDGAALRYVAEKLSKQNSDVKMLFIICDGQPNDDGYTGTAAEADLRGIKLEYSRKGVQIFAAAIGDDRANIERIYGAGYLDITDLNQLPIMLTQLIARNLPK